MNCLTPVLPKFVHHG